MPADISEKFTPYQEGDFIKETIYGQEKIVAYKGSIYSVTYPLHVDVMQEILGWKELGYTVGDVIQHGPNIPFRIPVFGDIPDWFKDRLKEVGVKCELTKERGEQVSF